MHKDPALSIPPDHLGYPHGGIHNLKGWGEFLLEGNRIRVFPGIEFAKFSIRILFPVQLNDSPARLHTQRFSFCCNTGNHPTLQIERKPVMARLKDKVYLILESADPAAVGDESMRPKVRTDDGTMGTVYRLPGHLPEPAKNTYDIKGLKALPRTEVYRRRGATTNDK